MVSATSRGLVRYYIAERCGVCVEEMIVSNASKHVRGVLYDGIHSREQWEVGDEDKRRSADMLRRVVLCGLIE